MKRVAVVEDVGDGLVGIPAGIAFDGGPVVLVNDQVHETEEAVPVRPVLAFVNETAQTDVVRRHVGVHTLRRSRKKQLTRQSEQRGRRETIQAKQSERAVGAKQS